MSKDETPQFIRELEKEREKLQAVLDDEILLEPDWNSFLTQIVRLKKADAKDVSIKDLEAWTESFIQIVLTEGSHFRKAKNHFHTFKKNQHHFEKAVAHFAKTEPFRGKSHYDAKNQLKSLSIPEIDFPEKAERKLERELKRLTDSFAGELKDYDSNKKEHLDNLNEHLQRIGKAILLIVDQYNHFMKEYKALCTHLAQYIEFLTVSTQGKAFDIDVPKATELGDVDGTTTNGVDWTYHSKGRHLSLIPYSEIISLTLPTGTNPGDLANKITAKCGTKKNTTIVHGTAKYETKFTYIPTVKLLNILNYGLAGDFMEPLLVTYEGDDPEAEANTYLDKYITYSQHPSAIQLKKIFEKKTQGSNTPPPTKKQVRVTIAANPDRVPTQESESPGWAGRTFNLLQLPVEHTLKFLVEGPGKIGERVKKRAKLMKESLRKKKEPVKQPTDK